jgi:AraC-like DNA-binding protein
MSWRRYLVQARLLRATALLAEPRPSVLRIATTVGFENASSFNRAFRQWTGETPSAFRAKTVRPHEGSRDNRSGDPTESASG